MSTRVNFTKIKALIVDSDSYSNRLLGQMLRGFGAASVQVAETVAAAKVIFLNDNIDLVICETSLSDAVSSEFVHWLRHLPTGSAKTAPVVVLTGYTQISNVTGARDAGASSVVRKPVSPRVLLDHIMWSAGPERPFIETDAFSGPDRRFKFTGPPAGVGRRASDLSADIGAATEPNLTQEQLNAQFKPTRISIE
ncbi:MAG: response regulator [Rhizomicrobium sp.]